MTESINFFQSIFTFKNPAAGNLSREQVKLAFSLKCEAQTLAATADEETRNGRTARDLAFAAEDKDKARVFAEISLWHSTRAADKYRRSAGRFEEAGKIQIAKRKACNLLADEMQSRFVEAETEINLLNNFLEQN